MWLWKLLYEANKCPPPRGQFQRHQQYMMTTYWKSVWLWHVCLNVLACIHILGMKIFSLLSHHDVTRLISFYRPLISSIIHSMKGRWFVGQRLVWSIWLTSRWTNKFSWYGYLQLYLDVYYADNGVNKPLLSPTLCVIDTSGPTEGHFTKVLRMSWPISDSSLSL